MLSKEKCERALKNLEEINLDIVLEELGYEKSERVSIYGINDYPTLEKQGDIEVIRELIKEHFEPRSYEFEDLKDGMYVYVSSCDDIYRIDDIRDEECIKVYGTGYSGCSILEYVEDEFYPVHIGVR